MFGNNLTSLVPSVVGLAQFFNDNFPNIWWYPNWYLGNPFNYLIGPVIPVTLTILHRISGGDFSHLYLLLIYLSQIFGGLGIAKLLREWGASRVVAILAGLLYILLPVNYFLLNYQTGLSQISLAILPIILLISHRVSIKYSLKQSILLSSLIAFSILIDISIVLPVVVCLVAQVACQKSSVSRQKPLLLRFLITFLAICLTTFWYTPGFWWTVLANPSLGGVPLFQVIGSLFNSLLNFVPLVVAIWVIKLGGFKKQPEYTRFSWLFLSSFLFLTMLRFAANPRFVVDWSSFLNEIQFGVAILAGIWLAPRLKNPPIKALTVLLGCILIAIDIFIGANSSNSQSANFQSQIRSKLQTILPTERVFLTGSPVFWANSMLNISQVRGGNDSAAISVIWPEAAYQIREGSDPALAKAWLNILGTRHILIHDTASIEPFQDYKYPAKFGSLESPDQLISWPGINLARVADRSLLQAPKPRNGQDLSSLEVYTAAFRSPAELKIINPTQIEVTATVEKDQIIALAMTYHSNWQLTMGSGSLTHDNFQNAVIIPKVSGTNTYILHYQPSIADLILPSVLALITLVLILKIDQVTPLVTKIGTRLSLGFTEVE